MNPFSHGAFFLSAGKNKISLAGRIFTLRNIIVLAIVVVFSYFASVYALTPFIAPQYDVLSKYSSIERCADIDGSNPVLQVSDALTTLNTPLCGSAMTDGVIRCVYKGSSTYGAPKLASDDQLLVCPVLTDKRMGDTAIPGVPVMPITRSEFQYGVIILLALSILSLIVVIAFIRHRLWLRKVRNAPTLRS